MRLASLHSDDIEAMDGKASFIKGWERLALEWWASHKP